MQANCFVAPFFPGPCWAGLCLPRALSQQKDRRGAAHPPPPAGVLLKLLLPPGPAGPLTWSLQNLPFKPLVLSIFTLLWQGNGERLWAANICLHCHRHISHWPGEPDASVSLSGTPWAMTATSRQSSPSPAVDFAWNSSPPLDFVGD